MDRPPPRERLRDRAADRAPGAGRCGDTRALLVRDRGLGTEMAVRGDLGGAQRRRAQERFSRRARRSVSAPPAPPIILASTSPQRRAILTQLGVPFEVVAPDYDEEADPGPLERAAGKARSVDGGECPVLGVDTEVLLDGRLLGK